jgi:plastocyanin
MKKSFLFVAVFTFLALGFWSCSHTSPSSPTPTSGAQTITVSIVSGGPNNYEYEATGVTNLSNGVLNLTAHVGDTISLPSGGIHTLYFDPGSATCIFNGATASTQTYTFTSAGTYYFHCGVHAQSCSNQTGCGSTNCTAMAGTVVVTP